MNKLAVLTYPNPAQDYINVSDLPQGIYYLQTITPEGISNIKFIKK